MAKVTHIWAAWVQKDKDKFRNKDRHSDAEYTYHRPIGQNHIVVFFLPFIFYFYKWYKLNVTLLTTEKVHRHPK